MTKRERISDALQKAALLTGGKPRVVRNRDGSIDGELSIPIKRGESFNSKLEEIERLLEDEKEIKGAKYAVGFAWEQSNAEPASSRYERIGGLNHTSFHYYSDLPSAILYAEEVHKTVRRRKYRKPHTAIIRVFHK